MAALVGHEVLPPGALPAASWSWSFIIRGFLLKGALQYLYLFDEDLINLIPLLTRDRLILSRKNNTMMLRRIFDNMKCRILPFRHWQMCLWSYIVDSMDIISAITFLFFYSVATPSDWDVTAFLCMYCKRLFVWMAKLSTFLSKCLFCHQQNLKFNALSTPRR